MYSLPLCVIIASVLAEKFSHKTTFTTSRGKTGNVEKSRNGIWSWKCQ